MAKIGEILVEKGLVSRGDLKRAIEESKKSGEVLGKTLLRLKFIEEGRFLEALGEQLGMDFYHSLSNIVVARETIDAVPVKLVWHYKFMPLKIEGKKLIVAVSDPMAIWFVDDLKLQLGYDIERVLATEKEISQAIRKYYGFGAETVEQILSQGTLAEKQRGREEQESKEENIQEGQEDASVINLVNQILSEAISARATDIHIEPYRDKVRVRYRIDGMLYDMNVPEQIRYLHQAIISRIKIFSNLDVVEKRLPQDGRAIVRVDDKQVDLRISIIPSLYGESAVIRILPVQLMFDLQQLGFLPADLKRIEEIMLKPHGIIFLTGPTGSGKTTTLYACLNKLDNNKIKIITIEDPVEYEISGIMQIQIKPDIGFTFAGALRSILRHDPDVMMIGEVRDFETAELAIRTALTGHLIFSTLHTNDAPSGATRLLDIGIEAYLVASSVNAFISQRLVRIICPDCKQERKDKQSLPDRLRNITVYRGQGCEKCKSIGYRGRTTIYEILPVVPEIQEMILNKVSASQIKQEAKKLGFSSMADIGIEKIKQGITTPEEVLQVTEI